MKLLVENVAKIQHAEVAVDGISILAGYNGTGKSTISKALSGVIAAYTNLTAEVKHSRFRSVDQILQGFLEDVLPDELLYTYNFNELISGLLSGTVVPPQKYIDFQALLCIHVSDSFVGAFSEYTEEISAAYADFLVQLQAAINRPIEEHIQFLVEGNLRRAFDNQINTLGQDSVGQITLFDDNASPLCYVTLKNNKVLKCSYSEIKEFAPIYLEPKHILDELPNNPRYFRIRRTRDPLMTHLLSHPEEDELAEPTIETHEKAEQVISMINEAIQGGLVENGNTLQYVDEHCAQPISLKNIASGNKTFAVIKRLVENGQLYKNHTLIIDEPEVNLHPAWQLILAHVLVILHTELGIKVFLNSHSPYFVRAVEVYANQHDIGEHCHFYRTTPGTLGLYQVEDVTGSTERIYRDLYLPFEEL